MADSSYESEVHGIEAFLAMQRNKDTFKNTTAPGGVSRNYCVIARGRGPGCWLLSVLAILDLSSAKRLGLFRDPKSKKK